MTAGDGNILVLNVGSSSIKYRVFSLPDLAQIDGNKFDIADHNYTPHIQTIIAKIHNIGAVVHRVVHGGADFIGAVRVTDNVLKRLETLSPFAPLHQPYNLAGIRTAQSLLPSAPHFACFDTSFHHGHDAVFDTYALPVHLRAHGLKRYGFHGLSYDWIASQLKTHHPHLAKGRVVVAHLGNGSSLCGLQNGKSIDTTMGLTALDGVPMGTRCGAMDAGLLIYLARNMGMTNDEIENILYLQSGLLGLSGISHDVKILLAATDPRAEFALDVYALKVAQAAAALTVSMGGMDGLVFTGGIGENAGVVRDKILMYLTHLQPFETLVIPTNEEWVMARDVRAEMASCT